MKKKHIKRLKKLHSLLLKVDPSRLDFSEWSSLDEATTGNSLKDIKGTFCAGGLAMQHKWFNKQGLLTYSNHNFTGPSYLGVSNPSTSLKEFFGISEGSYYKIFSRQATLKTCLEEIQYLIEKHDKTPVKQSTETLFNIVLVYTDSSTTNVLVKARSLEDAVNTAVYHNPHPQRIKFALPCVVDIKNSENTPEKIIKDFSVNKDIIDFNINIPS